MGYQHIVMNTFSGVKRFRRRGILLQTAVLLPSLLVFAGCPGPTENKLQAVQAAGELVVLTRNSPTTYYEGPNGFAGIEYDMIKAFADDLGVRPVFVVPDKFSDIIPMLTLNEADLAAAGLAITGKRQKMVRFAPTYQTVRQQLIYRIGTPEPKNIKDLYGQHIELQAGTRYVNNLNQLKRKHPKLGWTVEPDKDTEELLEMVWEGLLDYTVSDSHIFDLNRRYYPELRAAFAIHKPEKLAWAFPLSEDDSLYKAATKFINKLRRSGELKRLLERYYGAASVSNPINMTVYQLRIQNRLPLYEVLYEKAGKKYDIDWRLLAALGYQESYWDPGAVSPTGVRGIMQLTLPTARQMGVTDRSDPEQAIDGGAKYIRTMMDRLPTEIAGPDRIWMALASYNVGFGHVMDARIITRQQGGDPNKWDDVRQRLLLLQRRAWYQKAKHGYGRGLEAVRYVIRIRNYYEALVRYDDEQRSANTDDAIKLKAPAI